MERGRWGGAIATTAVVFSDGWIGVLIAVDLIRLNAIKLINLRYAMIGAMPSHCRVCHIGKDAVIRENKRPTRIFGGWKKKIFQMLKHRSYHGALVAKRPCK